MKIFIILALSLLTACSQTAPPVQSDDIREHTFIKLVDYVQSMEQIPTPEQKNYAIRLAYQSGLSTSCLNKTDCFLSFTNKRIRIDREWIHVEFIQEKLYIKVQDINEAVRLVYYS